MKTWPLFAFDNYFDGADRIYSPAERYDLLKSLGYTHAYVSINRAQDESWQKLLDLPEQLARTGLALAAAYTVVDLTNPTPMPGRSPADMLARIPEGGTFELALSVGWQKDCSDPRHDDLALTLLTSLLPLAKARRITISLYAHFGFWQERIEDCVRLARKIDDPALRVTFSGYHWYAIDRKDLHGRLTLAAPWLHLVNLCGAAPRPEGSTYPLPALIRPVGEGDFPLAELLTILRKIDYIGPVGFQGYLIGGSPATTLRASIAAFHQAACVS